MCTASGDGLSYSAPVTHFSSFSADNGFGADGAFGDLDPSCWFEVDVAFNGWIGAFGMSMMNKTRKRMRDCCMKLTGREFTCDYRGAVDYQKTEELGNVSDYNYREHMEVTRGEIGSAYYLHLEIELFWSCDNPEYVILESSRELIDLSKDLNKTSDISVMSICGRYRMPGVETQFTVSGPGSIAPATAVTGADGYAQATYTATDTGTARVIGTANSCLAWSDAKAKADTAIIKVDSCSSFFVYVELTFDHATEHFAFHDVITMSIPLTISETGEITSTGGEGTHAASLGTSGPDCDVTAEYAPDFTAAAIGQVTGPNMYLTIAPTTGWALLYAVTCIVDDKPMTIPMPPYNYLLPSIMAGQIFNEFPIAMQNGAYANGSGQDTQWGEDYPITYTYYINVGCDDK